MERVVFWTVIWAFIWSFIWAICQALILQYVTKWVCKYKPPYGTAFKICLFANIVINIWRLLLGFIADATMAQGGLESNEFILGSIIMRIVIAFSVYVGLCRKMLIAPEGGSIGFGNACLVTLILLTVSLVIAVVLNMALAMRV